jgi:hypothetical protein
MIFALAAIEDLELESVHILNTYLNGVLKDMEVFMKQLEGFTVNDSTWVAKLQKGLYGMKQGSCWYEHLDETLQSMAFRQLHSNTSNVCSQKNTHQRLLIMMISLLKLSIASEP